MFGCNFKKKAYAYLNTILEDVDKRLGPVFAEKYPAGTEHIIFLDSLKCQKMMV